MRVAIAFDHAGLPVREAIAAALEQGGYDVVDCGTDSPESVDYPIYAGRAAKLVSDGEADRAIVACGSGTGVSIVANKFDGVRAVNARDVEDAEMSRRHNDANVLALAGRKLAPEQVGQIVDTFLATEFEGGRHARRVDQITEIENGGIVAAKEATK